MLKHFFTLSSAEKEKEYQRLQSACNYYAKVIFYSEEITRPRRALFYCTLALNELGKDEFKNTEPNVAKTLRERLTEKRQHLRRVYRRNITKEEEALFSIYIGPDYE